MDPETELCLSYAGAKRGALAALLALDATLARILQSTTQPMVGQMRLAWWREAVAALGETVPDEPVLRDLAREVLSAGIAGPSIAAAVDGWEELLASDALDAEVLSRFAASRATLFAVAGQLLGAAPGDPVTAAGEGWALADLARHLSSPAEVEAARSAARARLAEATARRWSRPVRALGALAHSARMDLLPGASPRGAPLRVARLLRHRLTGR